MIKTPVENIMDLLIKGLIILFLTSFLAGCSSPRDRFIDAALDGKNNSKVVIAVMECVADKLHKELSLEEFEELTNDLIKINKKEISRLEANLKLMGMMAVANLSCKIE